MRGKEELVVTIHNEPMHQTPCASPANSFGTHLAELPRNARSLMLSGRTQRRLSGYGYVCVCVCMCVCVCARGCVAVCLHLCLSVCYPRICFVPLCLFIHVPMCASEGYEAAHTCLRVCTCACVRLNVRLLRLAIHCPVFSCIVPVIAELTGHICS